VHHQQALLLMVCTNKAGPIIEIEARLAICGREAAPPLDCAGQVGVRCVCVVCVFVSCLSRLAPHQGVDFKKVFDQARNFAGTQKLPARAFQGKRKARKERRIQNQDNIAGLSAAALHQHQHHRPVWRQHLPVLFRGPNRRRIGRPRDSEDPACCQLPFRQLQFQPAIVT